MRRRTETLRWQLLLALLAFGLLPLTIGATVTYVKSRAALLAQRQAALDSQAEAAGEKIDRNLFERYGDVQAFAFHPDAAGAADEVVNAALSQDPVDLETETDLDLTGDGVVDHGDLLEAEQPFDFDAGGA